MPGGGVPAHPLVSGRASPSSVYPTPPETPNHRAAESPGDDADRSRWSTDVVAESPDADTTPTVGGECDLDELSSALSGLVVSDTSQTAIAYDDTDTPHMCTCGDDDEHWDNPQRLSRVLTRLKERGLVGPRPLTAGRRLVTDSLLEQVHAKSHVAAYGGTVTKKAKSLLEESLGVLPCGGQGLLGTDTYWGTHSADAGRGAVGAAIAATHSVISGDSINAMAICRPPGHHAGPARAHGFCFFNNVGCAAEYALQHGKRRVAIVDFDIHHGDGTENAFYDRDDVLYVSIHRYDKGEYFPGTGHLERIGTGRGKGYNVNVPFDYDPNNEYGNVEYITVFQDYICPILHEFEADIVLVSAGFDAARGDVGDFDVTPAGFEHVTWMLMEAAGGSLVMCMEGGYVLPCLEECVCAVVRTLRSRHEPAPLTPGTDLDIRRGRPVVVPNSECQKRIRACARVHREFWPVALEGKHKATSKLQIDSSRVGKPAAVAGLDPTGTRRGSRRQQNN